MSKINWHKTHNVEVMDNDEHHYEVCIRCGFWGMEAPFPGVSEEECAGPSPLLGRTGRRVWINPEYMEEFMRLRNVVITKFWKKEWCKCKEPVSIGYQLARYQYNGVSCMACDRPGFAGYQHCHCARCGAICQTG